MFAMFAPYLLQPWELNHLSSDSWQEYQHKHFANCPHCWCSADWNNTLVAISDVFLCLAMILFCAHRHKPGILCNEGICVLPYTILLLFILLWLDIYFLWAYLFQWKHISCLLLIYGVIFCSDWRSMWSWTISCFSLLWFHSEGPVWCDAYVGSVFRLWSCLCATARGHSWVGLE